MTLPTAAQALIAQAAHAALRDGVPAPDSPEAHALLATARELATQAVSLASGNAFDALKSGAGLLNALGGSLAADAAKLNDPNLQRAADVMTGLGSAAGTVATALQSGVPLPYALADAAITAFIPEGSVRDLALGVVGALAYGETSTDPNYSAGNAILGAVAGFAADFAGQTDAGGAPTPAAYAAQFALPVLGYLAGGSQPGAEKYIPGALASTAINLIFTGTQRSTP